MGELVRRGVCSFLHVISLRRCSVLALELDCWRWYGPLLLYVPTDTQYPTPLPSSDRGVCATDIIMIIRTLYYYYVQNGNRIVSVQF